MFGAHQGPLEHVVRPGVGVEGQQTQDRACTPADDVESLVRSDEVVREQHGGAMGVGKQVIVAHESGHRRQGVHDRAQTCGTADAEHPRDM